MKTLLLNPNISGFKTAVFFLIIPNFCNFLILLQQGVVDNPTFLAMSLTGRVASFCRIDNI